MLLVLLLLAMVAKSLDDLLDEVGMWLAMLGAKVPESWTKFQKS